MNATATNSKKRARSPEQQAALKQRIVETARRLFAERGLENVSMRKLASELGYSPGTLYLYFPSQTDLFSEIWREDFDNLEAAFKDIVSKSCQTPLECLAAVLKGYARYWFERPDHFRVSFLIRQARSDCPECLSRTPSIMRMRSMLEQLVKNAIENGDIRRDDPHLITDSLFQSVYGVVVMNTAWAPGVQACPNKTVETVIDALLNGLRS